MIKLLLSIRLAEFGTASAQGSRRQGTARPRLPGPFVPYGLPGETVASADRRAAGPAKGCRQMSRDPVRKTKDVRAAVEDERVHDNFVGD